MPGNIPNVSRNSFDFTKRYGPIALQQGVPVHDSDVNEMLDNIWIRGIQIANHTLVGDCRFAHTQLGGTKAANSGMQIIQHATTTTNDFTITDGWAMVGGVLVPSTPASPPVSFDYEDQIIFTGTVDSVGSGNLVDTEKNWNAGHSLVGCRVKMTSGTESGNTFTITGLVSATTISLSGGTGAIAATDTYDLYPPALTTPGGADRDDLVYLMVFFDDIATEEDSAITHPGTGVEAVHKSKITSVVRVLENSTTMPASTEANLLSYGIRYLELATLERSLGNANILTSMIINVENLRSSINELYGVVHSGSRDSLTAKSINDQIGDLLQYVNEKVYEPTVSPGSDGVLLFRSHGDVLDAEVTPDTVSVYVNDQKYIVVVNGYFSSGQIVSGNGAGRVYYRELGGLGIEAMSASLSAGTGINPGVPSSWETYITHGYTSISGTAMNIDVGKIRLGSLDSYVKGSNANAGTASELLLLYESGQMVGAVTTKCRIYFGGTSSGAPKFWIVYNAYWDQAAQKWTRDYGADSRAICLDSSGICLCWTNASVSSTWNYDPRTGWDGCQSLLEQSAERGTDAYACAVNYGEMHERIVVNDWISNNRATADTFAAPRLQQTFQYRNKWEVPPTFGSYTPLLASANISTGPFVNSFGATGYKWGGYTTSTPLLLSSGALASYDGYVDIYT